MRCQHCDAMRCSRLVEWWCFCICKSMQAVTKPHAWDDNRARNPRFFTPIFGQKPGFRARMNEIKSGIPCSGWQHCDAMCCSRLVESLEWWCFCICKSMQAVFKKPHAWDDNTAMRCVALGWLSDEAFVFVKGLQAIRRQLAPLFERISISDNSS